MQSKTFLLMGTLVLALLCFYDAKKQGKSLTYAYIISILIIFFPLFALPFYIFTRNVKFSSIKTNNFSKNTTAPLEISHTKLCPKCGHDNPTDRKQCEKCNNKLTL